MYTWAACRFEMRDFIAANSLYIAAFVTWGTTALFGFPAKGITPERDISFRNIARVIWCDLAFARYAVRSLVSISYFIAVIAFWYFNISNLATDQFDFTNGALVSILALLLFRIALELFVSLSVVAENSNIIVEALDKDGSVRRLGSTVNDTEEMQSNEEVNSARRLKRLLDRATIDSSLREALTDHIVNGDYTSIVSISKKLDLSVRLRDINSVSVEFHQNDDGTWKYTALPKN